jgi:hypothetical protein
MPSIAYVWFVEARKRTLRFERHTCLVSQEGHSQTSKEAALGSPICHDESDASDFGYLTSL